MKILLPVHKNIYIANEDAEDDFAADFYAFSAPDIKYHRYCDDFGPMNAASVIEFIKFLEEILVAHIDQNVVFVSDGGVRGFTNAVFLMGSFLILKLKMDTASVSEIFSRVPPAALEGFRDATYLKPDFRLSLHDCWGGLARAQSFGWFDSPSEINTSVEKWGEIFPEAYEQYENPLNGNLTIIVPGKFIAFQGPRHLAGGQIYSDSDGKGRAFSPKYYLNIFSSLGVSDVVRLNESQYDARIFESAGISVHELEFDDCTSPPAEVVKLFLKAVDCAPKMIAVHCKAGLGRTGTLIALYLIRSFGFTAREAMGWMRIMRPGVVIGAQQHYLCEVERAMRGFIKHAPANTEPARNGLALHANIGMKRISKNWSSAPDVNRTTARSLHLPPLSSQRAAPPCAFGNVCARSDADESFVALASAVSHGKAHVLAPLDLSANSQHRSAVEAREVAAALERRALAAAGPDRRRSGRRKAALESEIRVHQRRLFAMQRDGYESYDALETLQESLAA